jgi:hypothetical protein
LGAAVLIDLVVSHLRRTVTMRHGAGAVIVATLRWLKEKNRRVPVQEKWLPEDQARLAETR